MCWHHWRLVPRGLQHKINYWYSTRALPAAKPIYKKAVRDAITAVKKEEVLARCK